MKLNVRCKNCRSDIYFRALAKDRFQLAKRKGEQISLTCESCGTRKDYNPNDVTAEEKKTIGLMAVLIFVVGTAVLFVIIWKYVWRLNDPFAISGFVAILTIPFLIYQGISTTHSERVRYFNAKRYG